jgi:hypothetical protein
MNDRLQRNLIEIGKAETDEKRKQRTIRNGRSSLNLCSRRRRSRQNSGNQNFPGGTEETAGGRISTRSYGCVTC